MTREERTNVMTTLYNLIWDLQEEQEEQGMTAQESAIKIDSKIYTLIARQTAKKLNIEIPRIVIVENMNSKDYGYYDNDNNTIALNMLLSPSSYIMIGEVKTAMEHISTLVHELRHKYQLTYNRNILINYVSPDEDIKKYKQHPSEVDAREYQAQWNNNHLEAIDMLINKL